MRQKLEIPFLRAKTINMNTLETKVPFDFLSFIRVSIYHNLVDLLFAGCSEKQAEQLACASLMEEAQLLQQALQCCKLAGLLYQKGGS